MLGLVLLGCFDDPLEFFRSLRPRERLAGVVVMGKEFEQEVLKLLLRVMNTLRQSSFAQNAEEVRQRLSGAAPPHRLARL